MIEPEHWIYVFARADEAGNLTAPVKVGISNSPDRRLSNIQTACPFKIKMAYLFECPTKEIAFEIEQSFHGTQAHKNTNGEWYDYEPIAAIHILCVAIRTALELHIRDQRLIQPSLHKIGVLTAERRFYLANPGSVQ